MKEPVRIFSDLHLGHRVSRIARVAALRPLLAGAGTAVFNGDTWQELAESCRERSAAMLAELRELCREEGAEAVFLSGNHDPGWAGPGWLELGGGAIAVTHGDTLFSHGSPWTREVMAGQDLVATRWAARPAAACDIGERIALARELARALAPRRLPRGRSLWRRAWDAVTPPGRALRMLEAWFGQAEAGARFCQRYFPSARALVIGHFHWPGAWTRRGRLVIDTGAWLNPSRAWCVEWRDGLLLRRAVLERGPECTLAPAAATWRFADGQAATRSA